jgi:hypothetical protein
MSSFDFDPEYVFNHHHATPEKLARYDGIHSAAKHLAEALPRRREFGLFVKTVKAFQAARAGSASGEEPRARNRSPSAPRRMGWTTMKRRKRIMLWRSRCSPV